MATTAMLDPTPAFWRGLLIGDVDGSDEFLGNPRYAETYRALEAKGNLVASRPRYIRKRWDERKLHQIAESVSPQARAYLLDPPVAFSWCGYPALVEVDRAIVTHAMGGRVIPMRDFGGDIAINDLPSIYKALLGLGSPEFLLSKIGVAYRAYLRPGGLDARVVDRRAVISLRDAVWPRYMCEHGMSGWFRAACSVSGGENVTVVHDSCVHRNDPACTWVLTWR